MISVPYSLFLKKSVQSVESFACAQDKPADKLLLFSASSAVVIRAATVRERAPWRKPHVRLLIPQGGTARMDRLLTRAARIRDLCL